jgi:hypothetical protein
MVAAGFSLRHSAHGLLSVQRSLKAAATFNDCANYLEKQGQESLRGQGVALTWALSF